MYLTKDNPVWLDVAKEELGVSEVRNGENPRILEYHAHTGLHASDDETAWCSSFVNFCMDKCGIDGTHSAAALSWLNWGRELQKPINGCIVVFDHGDGHGHVTFFDHEQDDGLLVCLGGNQSNTVKYSAFDPTVATYRWPE